MKASIEIDIGKRKCDYYIVNRRERVLEREQYFNTQADEGSGADNTRQVRQDGKVHGRM